MYIIVNTTLIVFSYVCSFRLHYMMVTPLCRSMESHGNSILQKSTVWMN